MEAALKTGMQVPRSRFSSGKWLWVLIGCLFFIGASSRALAAPHNVLILYESEKPFISELIHSIKEHITEDIQVRFKQHSPGTDITAADLAHTDLLIGIGYRISRSLAKQKLKLPILNLLVPLTTTPEFNTASPADASLVIDQPFSRQFRLISKAFGKKTRTGVLTGKSSERLIDNIKQGAKANHINLHYSHIDNPDALIHALQKLFRQTEVLLATPDPMIYNRKTIRSILLLSYRQRIPVVGYTQSYTKAGAVIAMYSTASQIGEHTAEIIYDFFSDGNRFRSKIIEPRYFSIDINHKVSRSLGFDLPDAELLKKQIEAGE